MPELPEIEIIKLGLEKRIVGLKLTKIQVNSAKSFIGNPNLVEGQKVLKVWRRAKILGMDLDSYQSSAISRQTKKSLKAEDRRLTTLLFHLKMSGQLIWEKSQRVSESESQRFIGGHPTPDMVGAMPNTHTRVIFTFENLESRVNPDLIGVKSQGKQESRLSTLATSHLFFNDQRRFGWVKVVDRLQVTDYRSLKNLGPEPLDKEFTWQILKQNLLKHKSMPVKVALMDQSVVSGIGNIYANEACFDAKIDPRTKVSSLDDQEFQVLYSGIVKSLQDGIKHGGSSKAHFVDAEGHKGYFLDYAFVYGRDKHPCKICGTQIKKIQLAGRGTYFCPTCQK